MSAVVHLALDLAMAGAQCLALIAGIPGKAVLSKREALDIYKDVMSCASEVGKRMHAHVNSLGGRC